MWQFGAIVLDLILITTVYDFSNNWLLIITLAPFPVEQSMFLNLPIFKAYLYTPLKANL